MFILTITTASDLSTLYVFALFNSNIKNIALILNTFKVTNANGMPLNLAPNHHCLKEPAL